MSADVLDQLLIIAAVEREADALRAGAADAGRREDVVVIAAGVGRVNAAISVTRMLSAGPPPLAIISAGVAGSLPGLDAPRVGDTIVASASIYHEEGLLHEDGFSNLAAMGFPLVSGVSGVDGNRFAADPGLASAVLGANPAAILGPVATVATCSGTAAQAESVRRRTGAIAEAMEGAAVLHAAAVFGTPAIELRTISNTTGDRRAQVWDLDLGLARLRELAATSISPVLAALRSRHD